MMLKYAKRKIKPFVLPVLNYYKTARFQVKWRDNNLHNETIAKNIFPIEKVHVGKGTYGEIKVYYFQNDIEFLKIGNYCSIAGDVAFILGGNHKYNTISTFPFYSKVYGGDPWGPAETKGPIIVEDDVWIGCHSMILSGVTLGRGCIISAGSVVAKNIPPYAIFIDGKVKKYRFSEYVISRLKQFSFCMDDASLKLFAKYYQMEINDDNIDLILNSLINKEVKND